MAVLRGFWIGCSIILCPFRPHSTRNWFNLLNKLSSCMSSEFCPLLSQFQRIRTQISIKVKASDSIGISHSFLIFRSDQLFILRIPTKDCHILGLHVQKVTWSANTDVFSGTCTAINVVETGRYEFHLKQDCNPTGSLLLSKGGFPMIERGPEHAK